MKKHRAILFVTALALLAAVIGWLSRKSSIGETKAIEIAKQELNDREGHVPTIISCSQTSNGGWSIIARSEVHVWPVGKPYHETWITKWYITIDRTGKLIDYREEPSR